MRNSFNSLIVFFSLSLSLPSLNACIYLATGRGRWPTHTRRRRRRRLEGGEGGGDGCLFEDGEEKKGGNEVAPHCTEWHEQKGPEEEEDFGPGPIFFCRLLDVASKKKKREREGIEKKKKKVFGGRSWTLMEAARARSLSPASLCKFGRLSIWLSMSLRSLFFF